MVKLTKKEIMNIRTLRELFPKEIGVYVHRSRDGGFVAEISDFSGCVTEGDTLSELIEMINDAMRTMLEIPKKYISFMPVYLLPLKMAQRFNMFPVKNTKEKLKFLTHEQTAR